MRLIVEALAPVLSAMPPVMIVWAVYLLTSVLTELVSNNAVAVVVTPIAIGLADVMGIDARPLVVAVMVAALGQFRDSHRVSDEHAGVWPRRIQVHRFHEGRYSAEPERGGCWPVRLFR